MDNMGKKKTKKTLCICNSNLRARSDSECGNIQISWLAAKGMVDWKIHCSA